MTDRVDTSHLCRFLAWSLTSTLTLCSCDRRNRRPSSLPSVLPSVQPTPAPTNMPTVTSGSPSKKPVTSSPTPVPTQEPTPEPTPEPTKAPSKSPTKVRIGDRVRFDVNLWPAVFKKFLRKISILYFSHYSLLVVSTLCRIPHLALRIIQRR